MADGRHAGPGVEHVRDAMLSENRKVHGSEKVIIPDLNRELPLSRQPGEELVESGREALRIDAAGLCQGLEFEDKRSGIIGKVSLIRLVDLLHEQVRIKKVSVDLAGSGRILCLGERVNGQLTPYLAHDREAWWQMFAIAPKHRLGGGTIVGRVDAYSAEERKCRVLLQHLGRRSLGAIVLLVDQPTPSRIVPGRRPEPHHRRNSSAELLEAGPVGSGDAIGVSHSAQ